MKIYTKAGDQGRTSLFGGKKVAKSNKRVSAYGTVDELNAVIGMAVAEGGDSEPLHERLREIQEELFTLGCELATPPDKKLMTEPLASDAVKSLESAIDRMEESLEPLKNFILPGGTRTAAGLHMARTVCRRAEREVVELSASEKIRPELIQYLNRLSDYLFVAARFANLEGGCAETVWKGSRS